MSAGLWQPAYVQLLTLLYDVQGCLKPVTVKIPPNSILSPSPEAAVVGGNVLTSQRVTDVILKAFNAAAASQVPTLLHCWSTDLSISGDLFSVLFNVHTTGLESNTQVTAEEVRPSTC